MDNQDLNCNNSEEFVNFSQNEVQIKHANYLFLITSILHIAIAIMIGTIIFSVIYLTKLGNDDLIMYYISPLFEIIAIFLPIMFYFLITKKNYKEVLRLNKIKTNHIIVLIIIGISAQFVGAFLNSIVIFLLQLLGKVPTINIPTPNNILQVLIALVIVAVSPAIFEEMLFRGVIFNAYSKIGIKASIIISSILFAIMHYDITNFVFPLFFGLILGYVVYRTNSLYSAIIVHFVNNALGVIILYVTRPIQMDYYETIKLSDIGGYFIIALISSFFLIGCIYYLYKTTVPDIKCEPSIDKISIKHKPIKYMLHWPILITIAIFLLNFGNTITNIIYGIQ